MYTRIKNKVKQIGKKILGIEQPKEIISAESSGRVKSTVLARRLLEYDVISFDIFDTLILRTLSKPTDVFMFVGEKLGILNYTTMRRDMEWKLRREKEAKIGSREVTFEEIYEEMEKYCGVDAQKGMEAEFQAELDFCIANPYMKEVFDLLKNYGKTIIIVSDMYFSKQWMEKLLSSCGYEGYDQLFISCEYGFGKRSGKLYQKISEEYLNGRSVIHVGDNPAVDVEMAQKQGWKAEFYQDIHTRGKKYRPSLMSACIGSAYRATVNIKMHSGAFDSEEEKALPYQYGYINGGILILGYVEWIHRQAKQQHMDKILFIARDGWIMKQVYDKLYDDIPSEYVYLSRNAALKLTCDYNRYDLLRQFVERRIDSEKPYTFREILISMELEHLMPSLEGNGIYGETLLDTKEKVQEVKELLLSKWDQIRNAYQSSKEAFRQYMEPILAGCSHVAAVDTGWRGTCPASLKYMIETMWKKDCKVTGMMMGSCKYKWNNTIPLLRDGSIKTYLFSPEYNDHLARFHYNKNLIHNTCIEFITSAPHPSVKNFARSEDGNYEIRFEEPEQENYRTTELIHQGVLDFVEDYKKYYGDMDMMWNIPALDAYWPIRFAMEKRFLAVIKKAFGDYVYNKYVGGLEGKRDMDTFLDMCRKEGV